jgi:hypothetical protein
VPNQTVNCAANVVKFVPPKEPRMCLRVLRGHLRGAKFLVLENLQFLARKHGGLAWPSPMYFVDKQFCSKSQIYDVLKALVDEQWIEPGHPRPRGRGSAWKVRSHEEWAELTQADDCSLLVDKRLEKTGLESPETGQKVRKPDTPVRSAPRSGQKTQVVPNPLFRPESQVVVSSQGSGRGKGQTSSTG